MALSTGAKIGIGCVVAFVVIAGGIAIAIFGAAWWGINKAKQATEELVGDQQRAEEALRRANANEFTPPADGVIAEDRLIRFLAVRQGMYGVYVKHQPMIEAQAKKENPDLSALAKLPGILMELRSAKAEALAAQGMSESEFGWLFNAVYRNLVVAAAAAQESGTATGMAEMMRSSGEQVADQAERAAQAAEADPNVPPEIKQQLRATADAARQQAAVAAEMGRSFDVPPANLELFKKHKDEILKYTMGGLELLAF
jgi:hypothetical protein